VISERRFVANRKPRWERLEELLAQADRSGLRRLGAERLHELALLYRAATSDLAAAQHRSYGEHVRLYLNRLVARAYARVYSGRAENGWSRLARFAAVTFPRELRRSWATIAACAALFVAAGVFAYALVAARPDNAYALLPAEAIRPITTKLHDSNFAVDAQSAPSMSAAVISNNVAIAALAFAGGITLGISTVTSIVFNGLYIGATAALYAHAGFGRDFWATVAPHGVFELSAIQIAGGAGFLLASAILMPGRRRRADALAERGRRAGVLIGGVSLMLLCAGLIEGFISPRRISEELRLGIGALTAAALLAYAGLCGAQPTSTESSRALMFTGALEFSRRRTPREPPR
jgi:uncharacterized membrane protein SpoIIM required for sporulation